ncbi:MAG: 4Fe-4S binding protein [Candidatus Marinimicrobia bacterium]|nr:4Fe-4S binding protein [Candidatus Neomarinimicrobiota bacterium]
MKEIVIISGKGGTGKTSLAAAFAYLGGTDIVTADCDVDAADLHLLLQPEVKKAEDFYSGQLARIDQDLCNQCGCCEEVCRFDAVKFLNGKYSIDTLGCEGCGYCSHVCPVGAIPMEENNVGEWYISTTKVGSTMVHARLGIGAENSGKLVTKVKNEAKKIAEEKDLDFVLVDGSPGVGCPVVSSLSGADFVILVTEPTVSGLHDLIRVHQLVNKFKIRVGCIINKADLNLKVTSEIKDFLTQEKIVHIGDLPYNDIFTNAMVNGQTIIEYDQNGLSAIINVSWKKIKKLQQGDN